MSFLNKIAGLRAVFLNKTASETTSKSYLIACRWSTGGPMGLRPRPLREATFLKKDGLPEHFQLVYKAPMDTYLSVAHFITTLSAGLMSIAVGYKLLVEKKIDAVPIQMDLTGLISKKEDLYWFAPAFVGFNVAIMVLIHKYPMRIYKNAERYVAVYGGQIPFTFVKHVFQKGEVSEAKSLFLNPWKDSMYNLGSRKSVLLIDHFKTPSELYAMMK